jgi:hypothetical protein
MHACEPRHPVRRCRRGGLADEEGDGARRDSHARADGPPAVAAQPRQLRVQRRRERQRARRLRRRRRRALRGGGAAGGPRLGVRVGPLLVACDADAAVAARHHLVHAVGGGGAVHAAVEVGDPRAGGGGRHGDAGLCEALDVDEEHRHVLRRVRAERERRPLRRRRRRPPAQAREQARGRLVAAAAAARPLPPAPAGATRGGALARSRRALQLLRRHLQVRMVWHYRPDTVLPAVAVQSAGEGRHSPLAVGHQPLVRVLDGLVLRSEVALCNGERKGSFQTAPADVLVDARALGGQVLCNLLWIKLNACGFSWECSRDRSIPSNSKRRMN